MILWKFFFGEQKRPELMNYFISFHRLRSWDICLVMTQCLLPYKVMKSFLMRDSMLMFKVSWKKTRNSSKADLCIIVCWSVLSTRNTQPVVWCIWGHLTNQKASLSVNIRSYKFVDNVLINAADKLLCVNYSTIRLQIWAHFKCSFSILIF